MDWFLKYISGCGDGCIEYTILFQALDFTADKYTILLIVIQATKCRDVAASKALKLADELDPEGQLLGQSINIHCPSALKF